MSEQFTFSHYISKVYAVLIMRNDGSRIYSKYYTKLFPKQINQIQQGNLENVEVQKAFEKNMYEKSKKLTNVKTMKSTERQFNIVFKILNDVIVYVIGDYDENEALLSQVLNTLNECINFFTKDVASKQTILDNYENLIICIDEMIDEGIIITLESGTIIARASMLDTQEVSMVKQESQSAFSSVFSSAKNSISRTLNLG